MKPEEYFHDHPTIIHAEDGIYMYWSELPPILLEKVKITEKPSSKTNH